MQYPYPINPERTPPPAYPEPGDTAPGPIIYTSERPPEMVQAVDNSLAVQMAVPAVLLAAVLALRIGAIIRKAH